MRNKYMNESPSTIFKFKGKAPAIIVMAAVVILCIALSILIGVRGEGLGGIAFCLGFALFLLFVGKIFLYGRLDVQIDEQSISRMLFGRKVQLIKWQDVERVVVFPVRGAGVTGGVTAYNICASASPAGGSRTRKIYFNDQSNDVSDLIRAMNIYIDQFQIRVEHVSNGVTTVTKSI